MKKAIISTCLALSVLMILDSLDAAHALFMFFLAGVIPGTNIVINAEMMLQMFALVFGFTLSRVVLFIIRTVQQTPHHSSKGTMLSAQS